MKRGKIIAMISSFLLVALLIVQPVLAWFIQYRTNFIVITGDIQLDVEGWYCMNTDDGQQNFLPMEDGNEFSFADASLNNSVAFKFEVVNKMEKDAMLSARLSNFSDYIFDKFLVFYNEMIDDQTTSEQLKNDIYQLANTNTAKLATIIDSVYYYDIAGEEVVLSMQDYYTWQYGQGEKLFEGISLPGVIKDSSNNIIESSVELNFTLKFVTSSDSNDKYSKWLCGYTDENNEYHVGFGQQRIANILGSTWEALDAADKTIADQYLKLFTDCEFRSISTVSQEGMTTLKLDIRYFEFIGDSVRP